AAPPRPGIDLGLGWTLSWVLCLGGVLLAAAYGAVAGPVAWRQPSWRGPLGRWLLWIALLPWVVWAAVVLLVEVAVWHQPGAGPGLQGPGGGRLELRPRQGGRAVQRERARPAAARQAQAAHHLVGDDLGHVAVGGVFAARGGQQAGRRSRQLELARPLRGPPR